MAEPKKTTKRRVRDPETFRERALKASESQNRPARTHRVRSVTGKIFAPIGRLLAKVFNRQPFRLIAKVLGFIGKILLPPYLRNSWRELRLVKWPSWRESRGLTFAVLAFAIVFGAAVAGVDWVLDKAFKALLLH